MKEIFDGVFRQGKKIYTANAAPGTRVYGEELKKREGQEYREWVPDRSKLAASILNGLDEFPFKKGTKALYLGASTGTTVSHLSDIVGDGIIYAVEFSERVMRSLMNLSRKRSNIVPVMADARKPEEYAWTEYVDVIYTDIAQPDETEIALRNLEFMKTGYLFVAIKSQSIDVTKKPSAVYKEERKKIEKRAGVMQTINLEPYQGGHAMIIAKV